MSSRNWIINQHTWLNTQVKFTAYAFYPNQICIGIPVIISSENGKSWTEVVEKFTTSFKKASEGSKSTKFDQGKDNSSYKSNALQVCFMNQELVVQICS